MTKIIPLGAETRERAGKGTARQTRRDGRIPAVIYGGKQAPLTISLEKFEFTRVLHQPGFFTHLFEVTVDVKPVAPVTRTLAMGVLRLSE